MTHIHDDPAAFKDDVIAGFALAYDRYVERVPDAAGFVRRGGPRAGKVSLVVGGGSGHYPSYAGIVGPGYADGCVLGDVFTSPSAEQVYRIGRAADGAAGVVFAFGNYAGDRLNFAAASERLGAEGIDARIVYVTDDIASAEPSEHDKRRGIAGTAVVYKVGGAAADSGCDLDEVERLMQAANAATFSYGVAFGGCTLPGRSGPLFTVAEGKMEFGLGIHGESGIRTADWMPAEQLAAALIEALLAERPDAADGRAALVVNGLGATKYEELFLLYRHVHALLHDAGIVAIMPEVGELVTSLDMAGCSVSLTWLDDELEKYWTAPVDSAAFRRGDVSSFPTFEAMPRTQLADEDGPAVSESSEQSRAASAVARQALTAMRDAVMDAEEELGRIDAVAGDGDHGQGMVRGLRAAVTGAEAVDGGVATVLRSAADSFGDKAGGTSGILWGIFLAAIGVSLGDTEAVTPNAMATAVRHGADTLQRIGKAQPGDKTMLDSLLPFVDAFESAVSAGRPLAEAWTASAQIAEQAAQDTASLVPKIGRARPLAEKSVGTPDAGAVSMAMVLTVVGTVFQSTQDDCTTSDD